ncbi:MAG: Dps family protein [Bacteroidia bacterium]
MRATKENKSDKAKLMLTTNLNDLLANYQIFYQNLRGLHWNIKGPKFFELHTKFEEFYNDALLKIDEIAERILTLGHKPLHSFTDYVKQAEIKEAKNISEANKSVELILDNLTILLKKERDLLNLSNELDDEGTNSLMSDYIKEHEKTLWMLRAFLS